MKVVKTIFGEAFRLAVMIAGIGAILYLLYLLSNGISWLAGWYCEAVGGLWKFITENPAQVLGIVALIYLGAILSKICDRIILKTARKDEE